MNAISSSTLLVSGTRYMRHQSLGLFGRGRLDRRLPPARPACRRLCRLSGLSRLSGAGPERRPARTIGGQQPGQPVTIHSPLPID